MADSLNLKAKAEQYRRLAESLLNPQIIDVVLACARDLEERAQALNDTQSELAGRAD